mgnify:CR=1 FL=1
MIMVPQGYPLSYKIGTVEYAVVGWEQDTAGFTPTSPTGWRPVLVPLGTAVRPAQVLLSRDVTGTYSYG